MSLIHITNVQTEDLSMYNCTAVNDQGSVSAIITLQIKGLSLSLVCLSVCLIRLNVYVLSTTRVQ